MALNSHTSGGGATGTQFSHLGGGGLLVLGLETRGGATGMTSLF